MFTVNGKEGECCFQFIHNTVARLLNIDYRSLRKKRFALFKCLKVSISFLFGAHITTCIIIKALEKK